MVNVGSMNPLSKQACHPGLALVDILFIMLSLLLDYEHLEFLPPSYVHTSS